MKRVAFLIPKAKSSFGPPSTPHVGVSYLAAYARAQGAEPFVVDLRVEPLGSSRLQARLEEISPDFVAVTSTSLEYKKVYALVNLISSWGWPVLYGGSHVSTVREQVFAGCEPYAAIYGEGEETLAEILAGKDLNAIPGLIFRNDRGTVVVNPPRAGIVDLDRLPFPAYELSKLHLYAERKIPLVTSRACPCHCTYCSAKLVMGTGFRARSPENVVAEIASWYQKGYRLFGINDDTFTADMARAERICELIIERKLDIAWELRTGIRVDKVNAALLAKMKAAGCIFLAFGIESIDDAVLKKARKGITFAQIEAAITAAATVGIPFSGFFMIGLPGDTYGKFLALCQFVSKHQFDELRFYSLEPYPSTEVFEWILQNGRFLVAPEEYLNDTSMFADRPLFETEDFPFAERVKAAQFGEYLTVNKLLIKTFGPLLGGLCSCFARQCHFRRLIMRVGLRLSPLVRKFHVHKALALRSGQVPSRC